MFHRFSGVSVTALVGIADAGSSASTAGTGTAGNQVDQANYTPAVFQMVTEGNTLTGKGWVSLNFEFAEYLCTKYDGYGYRFHDNLLLHLIDITENYNTAFDILNRNLKLKYNEVADHFAQLCSSNHLNIVERAEYIKSQFPELKEEFRRNNNIFEPGGG